MQGAVPSGEATLPEGTDQIFVLSQNVSDNMKEDLAWATYILLRNTNSISVVSLKKLSLAYILHQKYVVREYVVFKRLNYLGFLDTV